MPSVKKPVKPIIVYMFPPDDRLKNVTVSPFCMKIILLFKFAEIEFTTVESFSKKSRKGKMPWIDDNKTYYEDSHHIVARMCDIYGIDLDSHLSAKENAIGHAIVRTISENLYWTILYSGFLDSAGWKNQTSKGGAFSGIKQTLGPLLKAQVKGNLKKHGIGRHDQGELYSVSKKDIQALSEFLGKKKYFMGDQFSFVDITAFSFLEFFIFSNVKCVPNEFAQSFANISDYVHRIRDEFFPKEWPNFKTTAT